MKTAKVVAAPEQARLTAAVAALQAIDAGPLLEELRDAQFGALAADYGSRASRIGGLLCVDGFCIEPFLDAATALAVPDYNVTELVEVCLRTGPWAKVVVDEPWDGGRLSCECDPQRYAAKPASKAAPSTKIARRAGRAK